VAELVAVTADSNDHARQLAAVAADIARRRYAPLAAAWDAERRTFPREERRYLGGWGYSESACSSVSAAPQRHS
jgi:alkylation response protein AidB-like acyl-CoA dehydrogenase